VRLTVPGGVEPDEPGLVPVVCLWDESAWQPLPSLGDGDVVSAVLPRLAAVALRWGEAAPEPPVTTGLGSNRPNPFNPRTEIPFELAQPGGVRLTVWNLLGQRVRTLVDGTLPAGRHAYVWEGRDEGGRPVASGVYFYRLETPEGAFGRRMVLLR
jgi:hypothetical protein